AVHPPHDQWGNDGSNDGSGQHGDFLDVESAIVIQPGVGKVRHMLMFQLTLQEKPHMIPASIEAHRAPDPAPIEEPPKDPFDDTSDPHQPPIRTPMNDEPNTDPNPSIARTL